MDRRDRAERTIAVAVDKGKASKDALKWAIDNLIGKDQSLKIVYVKERSLPSSRRNNDPSTEQGGEHDEIYNLLLSFRCFCRRRQVQCETIVLEDTDVARALIDFISQNRVDALLLGASPKTGLSRLFKSCDVPGNVMKWAPDFCTIYIISKGRINSVRNATRPLPVAPAAPESVLQNSRETEIMGNGELFDELPTLENDAEADCGRLSTDSNFISFYKNLGSGLGHRSSYDFGSETPKYLTVESEDDDGFTPAIDVCHANDFNGSDNFTTSRPSQNTEVREDEMRRLTIELKHTIDMYHAACKDALAAKQQAWELEQWKMKEEKRVQDAVFSEQKAMSMVGAEKAKCKAAIEEAEMTQKLLEIETRRRVDLELRIHKEVEERKKCFEALGQSHVLLKYQSLYHMIIVVCLFYFYFSVFMR